MTRLAVGPLLVLLGLVGPWAALRAQDPRDTLVARAFNEFDTPRRVQLLMSAVNPNAGPPTGAWANGVQLLAQTLIEEGNDSLAGVWLRWAVRVSPSLQVDTVQFVPAVAAAFAGAHDFVERTRTPGDSLTTTTWLWPSQGKRDSPGQLQVSAPSITGPLQASAEGIGPLASGAAKELAPGSYAIRAGAAGYDDLAVTREVLPGVTTVLEFRLQRSANLADQGKPVIPDQIEPEPKRKKFPWVIVLAGVAGAGAVAALAGGGGEEPPPPPPTTGGITIHFPQ
jgi:hypothetical protein